MLGLVAFLHQRLAIALIIYALVLGAWGTYRFIRFREISGGYRSSYLLMTGLTGLQSLAGLAGYLGGGRPRETLHVVYGIFAIVFLPGIFVLAGRGSGPQARAREAAYLAAAAWIVLIAFGRGIATGR